MHRPGRLSGKVAIVTGAAGGIGRVLVEALRAEGAEVCGLDIQPPPGTDISDPAACRRAAAEAIARLGGLHILVNNAALGLGLISAHHQRVPIGIEEIEPAMWQRFVATNISGAWNMTRACIAHLRAQRWGRIVNITTSFSTMLRGGFHPYGPCKAALEAMSAGHAEEFAGSGVTVNVVVPGGPVDTPMIPPESGYDRSALIPPAVMAPPIVWLCSDAANGIPATAMSLRTGTPRSHRRKPSAAAARPSAGPASGRRCFLRSKRYAASWLRSILRLMCSPALIGAWRGFSPGARQVGTHSMRWS